jgi:RHS repeat-associated protein
LQQQVSPDTGTTTNTYDSGSNLATSTDARGAISTYTYDSLNRVTTAAFKIGATTDQTITYNYDAGTYGKGRLTSASDSDHSMSWTYDALGRVTSKAQVVGGFTKTVGYAYTNGQLTTLTLPSGRVITYGYTHERLTSIQFNTTTTVLSNVLYEPFGAPRQWTWGNGTLTVRTHDLDGKITQIDSAGLKTYSYDDAFRITGITDTTNAANSWTYGYDALDRLTSGAKPSQTMGWSYDANGNRLAQSGPPTQSHTYSATSNRALTLTGSTSLTYSYDPAGNVSSDSIRTYSYNYRGRIKSITAGGITTTYTYNVLGERIRKSGSRLFVYDEAGHLIGEYDSTTGAVIQETIWMNDTPVAVIAGSAVFYIHTDHLNTPRKITNTSNGVRWQWDPTPFGNGIANQNPQGLGGFNYFLRFPGQYYDNESQLHYNYFRNYDSYTGRYTQSDPIGLAGGLNTYAYVGGNPVSYVDPSGLFLTSVDAACIANPQFCAEIFGQLVENAGAISARLTGDTCAAEEAYEAAEIIRTAGLVAAVLPLVRIVGSVTAARETAGLADDAARVTARGPPNRIYSARELVRRAAEPGPYHNFPESFNAQIFRGNRQAISDNYVLYTQRGTINGVNGTFEIGVRPSVSGRTETILHRFFRPD